MSNSSVNFFADFRTWLKNFLKPKGLQPTLCGFKSKKLTSDHDVDATTGKWKKESYSQSKPIRWLFQIRSIEGSIIALPASPDMANIGFHSSGQGNKAALVVRILPVISIGEEQYTPAHEMEAYAVFAFREPLEAGGNADPTAFDPATGQMQHRAQGNDYKPQPYIFACLLGVFPRHLELHTELSEVFQTVNYGELIDALAAAIHVTSVGETLEQIPVYDLSNKNELEQLCKDFEAAFVKAGPSEVKKAKVVSGDDEEENEDNSYTDPANIEISEHPGLLGIDQGVYQQINAALHSGKQHMIFYGPPGTGKTTLARWVAGNLSKSKWMMITGSADWSSQDIIGGYQPIGDGQIKFFPGVLLRNYDRPLIIDELNRCDIDKVIGPLFTVLSGQETTLPYRVDVENPDSEQFTILPEPKAEPLKHEFAPGYAWRMIATINSIDKGSLYQMSYALSRRFGWVYVDVPSDKSGFIREYLKREYPKSTMPDASCPLGEFWSAINEVREIGPALIIDVIKAIRAINKEANFFAAPTPEMRIAILDAVDMVLLPMLDGIVERDADKLAKKAIETFQLEGSEKNRITERIKSVAV